jgi:hypothetical protein
MIIAVAVFVSMVFIRDNNFYEGQAVQIYNQQVEAYYKKGEDQYPICSDGSIHKLFKRD